MEEDGSISTVDGLGLKAMDSHELRKKQLGIPKSQCNLRSLQTPISRATTFINSTPQTFSELCPKVRDTPVVTSGSLLSPSSVAKELVTNVEGKIKVGFSSPKPLPLSSTTPQSPTHSNDPTEFGVHSPKITQNSSPAGKLHRIFQQELQKVETEERIKSDTQQKAQDATQRLQSSSQIGIGETDPRVLRNARGDLYPASDPFCGYPVDATIPRTSVNHQNPNSNPNPLEPPSSDAPPLPFQTQGATSSTQHQDSQKAIPQLNRSISHPDPNKGKNKN